MDLDFGWELVVVMPSAKVTKFELELAMELAMELVLELALGLVLGWARVLALLLE